MRISFTFLIALVLTTQLFPQQLYLDYFDKNIEVYFSFEVSSRSMIRELTNIISIDKVDGNSVFAYANKIEYDQFLNYNIEHRILQKPSELIVPEMSDDLDEINDWDVYPTYDGYVNMMTQFANNYPAICKLIDAGNTVQGRKILLVKISDNVNVREAEPQFLYTSTMHGDETTGYVLMLRLIDSLLTAYGSNSRITNLIDNAEIWINPNANPDGTYHGGNGTVYGATRYNANGYDLNRNFPDPEYGVHSNQQTETTVFRNIAEQNNFVLCANFHGGTEVVNYPWDTWTNGYPDYVSHTDESWYQFISHLYADTCQAYSPSNYMTGYDDGITNGGTWYVIHHGRQDSMNWFMKSREVTIEISDTKLLPASQLPAHWEYNKRSFLNYIESIFYGVSGSVTDTLGNPLNTIITVLNHDTLNSEIRTDSVNGNYHRMLAPGTYSLHFSADGFYPQTISNVTVNNFQTTLLDVQLVPEFIPVELISFSANVIGSDVDLKWQTASEMNNRGFEVQRKSSGQFESIAFVEGKGTTTETQTYLFRDKNVPSGTYTYRLKQVDFDGSLSYSDEVEIEQPAVFHLTQNYPNPFNPSTSIQYSVPTDGNVSLRIYDILGNEVGILVDEFKQAGTFDVTFDGSNLSSGVYYYRLTAGENATTKKLMLTK